MKAKCDCGYASIRMPCDTRCASQQPMVVSAAKEETHGGLSAELRAMNKACESDEMIKQLNKLLKHGLKSGMNSTAIDAIQAALAERSYEVSLAAGLKFSFDKDTLGALITHEMLHEVMREQQKDEAIAYDLDPINAELIQPISLELSFDKENFIKFCTDSYLYISMPLMEEAYYRLDKGESAREICDDLARINADRKALGRPLGKR